MNYKKVDFLRSSKLISREGINSLKTVVVNITLPAVLIGAFDTTTYTFMDVVIPLMMYAVCCAAWALGRAAEKVFHMSSRFVPFLTTGFDAEQRVYVSSVLSLSTVVSIIGFAVLAVIR